MRRLSWLLVGAVTLGAGLPARGSYLEREDVRAYLDELVAEHGFDRSFLDAVIGDAQKQQPILDAIARPAERVLEWHEYRDRFLKEPRVSRGLEFWHENADALRRAQMRYGVAPEYIVAIIGVETSYGRVTGTWRVIDALATLGFDYPPRADFFRSELTQYLLLGREEGFDLSGMTGSYAGAMGYGQFIPSSYRAYAVDFDADGHRDIWNNTTDAIGSVANYFARHGWIANAPVATRVDVPEAVAVPLANTTLELDGSVAILREAGVPLAELSDDSPAELLTLKGDQGNEYWAVFGNFYVITRYNRSRLYALAVHSLAQAILARHEALAASP